MEEFRKRIATLLKDKKITLSAIAGGKSSLQVKFSRQINGDASISYDVVKAFLDYFPDVSAEWLLRGEGEMYRKEGSDNQATPFSSRKMNLFAGAGGLSENPDRLMEIIQSAITSNNEYIKLLVRMQAQQNKINGIMGGRTGVLTEEEISGILKDS